MHIDLVSAPVAIFTILMLFLVEFLFELLFFADEVVFDEFYVIYDSVYAVDLI